MEDLPNEKSRIKELVDERLELKHSPEQIGDSPGYRWVVVRIVTAFHVEFQRV